jgi:chorismate mutase
MDTPRPKSQPEVQAHLAAPPVLIAGPCSAESEQQVMEVARALVGKGVSWFRAGIWKPRTRPGSFAGVGAEGLPWLESVTRETGLKTAIEVANAQHVELALKHGVDLLWVGARTTPNPFSVQEIADALRGTQVKVMVKNPINPDLDLWMGAIERMERANVAQVMACHRGFNVYVPGSLRNAPLWEISIELMRRMPSLTLLCDPSHICGNRELLSTIAQKALDLGYDGLMVETHHDPDHALSDAQQQITPEQFGAMLARLHFKLRNSDSIEYRTRLSTLRTEIDEIDRQLTELIAERMHLSRKIGALKNENSVAFYQTNRWNEVLQAALQNADKLHVRREFVEKLFNLVHLESIDIQGE